jgi:VIT1/CCC1 family predicted Fe2+/Mn2+ transporter
MKVQTASAAQSPRTSARASKRALDPIHRVSEILFGLIMVLTFTGSLSVAAAGRAEVRTMLIGALGCNVAWGIIDALLYLLDVLAEKGSSRATWLALQKTTDREEARRLIAGALPPVVASILETAQLDGMRERLVQLPTPSRAPRLQWNDWRAGLGIFLLVFAATLPVVIPFIFIHDPRWALHLSNAIAIVMLFLCGHSVGRMTGYHPWGTGLGMVVLGSIVVAMTIALGG